MISERQLFLNHVAQTSSSPIMLEIDRAEGVYLISRDGKKYIDLISGISVSNLGHSHPAVIKAINDQVAKHMHLMVYGEYVQTPQVKYASLLTQQLPDTLNNVYFVNSGSEAIEGALKLAKRFTGRSEIVSFKNAYHGSTHGALSVMGNEEFKNSFRPLVPGVKFLEFNKVSDIESITKSTACVIIEPVQGEAGIVLPIEGYLQKIKQRCDEVGALLIFDEIQTGFGRTGKLFAFEQYNVVPDVFTIAKAMGGGLPIGAFVSSQEIMSVFKSNPTLGHITTFGGHPVSCAAALASLSTLLDKKIIESVPVKEKLLRSLLIHKKIKEVRGKGLFFALDLGDADLVQKLIQELLSAGIVVDWFLFDSKSIRIAPPLIISEDQIYTACSKILKALDSI